METNWVFQEPIDFEHKQYVILDYLQKVDKQLTSLKLYPNFQQISFHLANINLIIEKGQFLTLNRNLKDPDDEILISDLIANEVPLFTREEIGEIYNQNQKNIDSKQGLFFIKDCEKTILYEFVIKPIKRGATETKCIIKKVCSCENEKFEEGIKNSKSTLIKNLKDPEVYKNLILFRVYHTNQFPFKETILPITKRKVMNYMIQSKLISKNNLTKKTS